MRFLLDVNVLIALSLSNHQHHQSANRWFDRGRDWATTPLTESSYLRLLTNEKVVGYPVTPADARAALLQMRAVAGHRFVADTTSLSEPRISLQPLVGTRQVTDFHLVNLAAIESLQLATFDRSLRRSLAPDDQQHVHVIDT